MKAVRIRAPGGAADVLELVELPVPRPQPDEVLIRVEAAGVNRVDIILRKREVELPLATSTDICGMEVSGEVVSIGAEVDNVAVGDAVCTLLPATGGYADYCRAPASLLWPVPAAYSSVEVAGLPEALLTVYNALYDEPVLLPGESLLVHGGTSGIGTMAINLARELGNLVLATAGNRQKCQALEAMGVERAIDYGQEDFVDVVHQQTDGRGVDVILDIVGGHYVARNVEAVARRGRIVQIGLMESGVGALSVALLMTKLARIIGASLWFQSVEEKARLAAIVRQQLWPLVESGAIRPVIDSVLPSSRAADAHRLMEQSSHIGKIILTLSRSLSVLTLK